MRYIVAHECRKRETFSLTPYGIADAVGQDIERSIAQIQNAHSPVDQGDPSLEEAEAQVGEAMGDAAAAPGPSRILKILS